MATDPTTTTTTRCVACGAAIAPGAPRVEAPAPSGGGTWSLHARAADCIRVILERTAPHEREGTLQAGYQADQRTP